MDASVVKLTTSSSIATKERVTGSSRRCVLSGSGGFAGGTFATHRQCKEAKSDFKHPTFKTRSCVIDVQGLLKASDEEEAILSETMKPNVVNHTREIFLTLNRTIMAARWFHLCNPPHGTSFIRIPLRFTADQTGVKHTFLCLPPTFSSVPSSLT